MQELTTNLLAQACRIFMGHAYPEGVSAIPEKKRVYYDITAAQPVSAYLPPAACAQGICQESRSENGTLCGYAIRLGSSGFPHLKLRLQLVNLNNIPTWVFMVDTHDAFSKDHMFPPPDHPDAKSWLLMQKNNRILKEKIETAFEQDGLATANSILRS
jgi:hypothetical protein